MCNAYCQQFIIFCKFSKFSSATIDDFWSAMQDAHNAIEIPNIKKFDVKEVMNTWTKQKHYPILRLRAQPDSEYVRISVENINNLGEDNWFIPITVTKQEEPNFKIYTTWRYYWKAKFLQDFSPYVELSIPRKEDEWIIVNLQQVGKY